MTLAVLVAAVLRLEPLPPELHDALERVRPDPAPEEITRATHYLSSNEWRLDLFSPRLAGTGGALVGVGADQNYLLAGWARSSLVLLCDFDQWIVDLHDLYGVVLATAETPQAFIDFWDRTSPPASIATIRAEVHDKKRAQRLIELYRFARVRVFVRLTKMRAELTSRGVDSFLTTQADYDHVAALSRAGRIISTRADLTKRGALRQLADALGSADVPVHAIYLSNAEQYFAYGPQFRANVAAWPADGSALLLRTRPMIHDYTYVVQPLSDFREQLSRRDVHSVRDLAPKRVLDAKRPYYEVPREPPFSTPHKLMRRRPQRPMQASAQ
jgi:hypothetical protein